MHVPGNNQKNYLPAWTLEGSKQMTQTNLLNDILILKTHNAFKLKYPQKKDLNSLMFFMFEVFRLLTSRVHSAQMYLTTV
jgi:hypothetical protein